MTKQFEVGGEVVLFESGKPTSVVTVTRITPSGLVDAPTGWDNRIERWSAEGRPRGGDGGVFKSRQIMPATPDTRAAAIANMQRAAIRRGLETLLDASKHNRIPDVTLPLVLQYIRSANAVLSQASDV